MRIAVFTDDFYPSNSGGAYEQWEFCKNASELQHDVIVYTYRNNGQKRFEQKSGVEINRPIPGGIEQVPDYALLSVFLRSILSILLLIYAVYSLYSRDIDVIYSAPYSTYLVGKIISFLYRTPSLSYVSNSPSQDPDRSGTVKLLLEDFIFSYLLSNNVICRTETIREILKNDYGKDATIAYGFLSQDEVQDVNTDINREEDLPIDNSNEDIILINIGRAIPLKNQAAAIHILNELPNKYKLLIVGGGPALSDLRDQVDSLDLNDRVHLAGEVDHEKALEYLLLSDALAHTSETESGPIVLFEALALGCVAFSTPVGQAPHLNESNVYCEEIPHLTERISQSPIKELSQQSIHEGIIEKHSMEAFTKTVIARLSEVCNE